MELKMKYLIPIILLMISLSTVAAGSCGSTGCTGTPKELFVAYYNTAYTDGRVFLHLKDDINKQNINCPLAEGSYITLKKSHPLFKEIYSSLLSALAMDNKVHVRIKTGTSGCEVLYTRIYI
jgi:hypothetical protein